MEVDSPPVVRRIVELLFPSFLPLDQTPQEQVSRCMTLIESNAGAARVFFLNAPRHLTLSDTGTVQHLTDGSGFFLACDDLGRMLDQSFPACDFFFKVITLHTLIPLFRSGSVHSGSAS